MAGEKAPAIRGEKVAAATGKSWDQWFRILDRWKALEKGHRETAKHLREAFDLSPWWSQMVTVEHERARGARDAMQRSSGAYATDVSRTIDCGIRKAFDAWRDPRRLSAWFTTKAEQDFRVGGSYSNADGDRGRFLAIVPLRRIRFTWENSRHHSGSEVEVRFVRKEDGRTVVYLTHDRLRTKKDAEDLKTAWSWAMDSLKSYLETGRPIPHEEWLARRRKKR